MSLLRERTVRSTRPLPDEADLSEPRARRAVEPGVVLRASGAIAVLVVGAVHLDQYFVVHFDVVPTIGPLFLLNFIGATVIGLGLLIPSARLRVLHMLLALGGIGLAATAFVFLLVSEHRTLFGFHDYGYRTAIVVALAAEAAAVVLLAGFVATTARGRPRSR
jgi:hypothetical protein